MSSQQSSCYHDCTNTINPQAPLSMTVGAIWMRQTGLPGSHLNKLLPYHTVLWDVELPLVNGRQTKMFIHQPIILILKAATVIMLWDIFPDSKVHGANVGPTWVLSAPDGPHDGPMNLAIRSVQLNHEVCHPTAIIGIIILLPVTSSNSGGPEFFLFYFEI